MLNDLFVSPPKSLLTRRNIKLPTWTKVNRDVKFRVALYYRSDICWIHAPE